MSKSTSLYFAYEELGRQVVLYKRVIIALIIAIIISVISSIILASSWSPQVRFVLLRDNGTYSSASLLPANLEINQKQAIYAQLIGQYVKDRHSIDNVTDENRFRTTLASMSDERMSNEILDQFKRTQTSLNGATRSIAIKSIVAIGDDRTRVEFKTIDVDMKGLKLVRNWEANAHYRILGDSEMNSEIMQYNPSGIMVFEYSIVNKD
jgi:type IV secretory pathway component VirB8